MLHSSEWHMRDLSAFGVSKDTLWAVRDLLFTKDSEEQITVMGMNIYIP